MSLVLAAHQGFAAVAAWSHTWAAEVGQVQTVFWRRCPGEALDINREPSQLLTWHHKVLKR